MQFIFQNLPGRQEQWARDGLGLCTYPLQDINSTVFVLGIADLPASDTTDAYMTTSANLDGTFTISIPPWADDPADPRLSGLPDPSGMIQQFFTESFVHEIGHVVAGSTYEFELDGVREMCALFWIASGPGVRSGGALDYFGNSWAANIREAVAEVFKCTWYAGQLLFLNRTRWVIHRTDWAAFLDLMSPINLITGVAWTLSESTLGETASDFLDFVTDYTKPLIVGGSPMIMEAQAIGLFRAQTLYVPGSFSYDSSSSIDVLQLNNQGFPQEQFATVEASSGKQDFPGPPPPDSIDSVSAGNSNSLMNAGGLILSGSGELSASVTQTGSFFGNYDYSLAIIAKVKATGDFFQMKCDIAFNPVSGEEGVTLSGELFEGGSFITGGGAGAVRVAPWFPMWSDQASFSMKFQYTKFKVSAPYPFAPLIGLILPGPAAQGMIRIG